MRIGEFSEKHDTTIDTIRHYMDLELIIPKKKGSHYYFDASCDKDLEEILKLKELGFSLKEIQKVFAFNRISAVKTKEDIEYIKDILNSKYNELDSNLQKIRNSMLKLKEYINKHEEETKINVSEKSSLGLPLNALSILSCPKCDRSLNVSSGKIKDNMIINGTISCSNCGFKCNLEDGIIINLTKKDLLLKQSKPFEASSSLGDYTEKSNSKYINFIYRAVQWIIKKVDVKLKRPSTILELGTGSGFCLRHLLDFLHQDSLYIVTDINLHRIKEIKERLESNANHKNFLFICSDFLNLPIKNQSIDFILDYLGSTCYNFEKDEYLIHNLDRLLVKNGLWSLCYYYFDKNSNSVKILPRELRHHFFIDDIESAIKSSSFIVESEDSFGPINETGESESFLIPGDNLYQKRVLLRRP